ncbi:MAG: DUF2877 domain-containing protein [Candidatus Auribacterota bacterium]|nr:DUF2877 domain-containing protein [Candidatus Auribacterota bacterium]
MVQKIEIVSIGDRIFPGEYSLHSRFRRVVNFTDGERLVALVTEEVGRGPVNIVARGLDPGLIDDTLRMDPGTITINGGPYPFDRAKIFHSYLGVGLIDNHRLPGNLGVFEDALLDLSPPGSLAFLIDGKREANFTSSFEKGFVERVKEGTQTIFGGTVRITPDEKDIISGVKKIKGLGFGLTPSGDDFIAGLLVALDLIELIDGINRAKLREEIVEVSRGGNLLSNSFIALVGDGYLFEGFKDLLSALIEGDKTSIRARTENLISLGASSGSDMAVGFLLTINFFYLRQKKLVTPILSECSINT